MKAKVTRKKISLCGLFFMNYAKSSPGFYLFKIKMSIHIFGTEKCKVTSGLKYVIYI